MGGSIGTHGGVRADSLAETYGRWRQRLTSILVAGIEAARIILGHRSAAITEVYAEKDEQEAIEAILKVG